MNVNIAALTLVSEMAGEDAEETALLHDAYSEAANYVRSFTWCRGIKESYFGLGVGGVVAVFLFRIEPAKSADKWLWVVTGDLPSCYLVTDHADEPVAALTIYCTLMEEWIIAVRARKALDEVYPVATPATAENAELLEKRVTFLRREIIPAFSEGKGQV